MASHSLVTLHQGEPVTGSDVIAEQTQVQHKNVMSLIRGHRADLDEFGQIAFETRVVSARGAGKKTEVALLNEPQATLLLTYMRNNDIVKAFKKALVRAFFELRDAARAAPAPTPAAATGITISQDEYIELLKAKISLLERPAAKVSRPAPPPISEQEKAKMRQLDQLGLSQREIARRTGRSAAAVSYIVREQKERQ